MYYNAILTQIKQGLNKCTYSADPSPILLIKTSYQSIKY